MMRGGLISMLYTKATDITLADVDPSSSLTLMSADIERIVTGMQTAHEIWSNTLEVRIVEFDRRCTLTKRCRLFWPSIFSAGNWAQRVPSL